jgi:hypothetical protein
VENTLVNSCKNNIFKFYFTVAYRYIWNLQNSEERLGAAGKVVNVFISGRTHATTSSGTLLL